MTARGYWVSFIDDENVLKLIELMVAQLHEYTKTHEILHFPWVNCMIGELYLNKADDKTDR